jgi:hypothetical protein
MKTFQATLYQMLAGRGYKLNIRFRCQADFQTDYDSSYSARGKQLREYEHKMTISDLGSLGEFISSIGETLLKCEYQVIEKTYSERFYPMEFHAVVWR